MTEIHYDACFSFPFSVMHFVFCCHFMPLKKSMFKSLGQQAEQLGREDQQRLHRNKKLVLMVDLDQTLIHTTEQHCQRMSTKVVTFYCLTTDSKCVLMPPRPP